MPFSYVDTYYIKSSPTEQSAVNRTRDGYVEELKNNDLKLEREPEVDVKSDWRWNGEKRNDPISFVP